MIEKSLNQSLAFSGIAYSRDAYTQFQNLEKKFFPKLFLQNFFPKIFFQHFFSKFFFSKLKKFFFQNFKKIFFSKLQKNFFFQNFKKFFFSKLKNFFLQNFRNFFFSKLQKIFIFHKIFFSKFFSNFFPKIFFQLFFLNLFFKALLSMLSRLQRQNGLYVSVLWKIWYTGQYSIPITAYKIFSTSTVTTPLVIILPQVSKFEIPLPCMKYRSGIEIQSNIMILILILILNRIMIFTKTLRSDTKYSGYL